jgi:alpha-tubulin suppressor-like RCC1 family protein
MPNYSGRWGLSDQMQAVAAGTWTGLPTSELWAWGYNNKGQIGNGTIINRSSPVQVGALTNWSQVSAGNLDTAAVKTDGTLWAWGYNVFGAVGDGTIINRSSPVQVGALTNWSQISAGQYHPAALYKG